MIVRTRAQEFHYPKGEDNVYTQYDGTGGMPLGSFWRKLLFAAHFRNYQILLSDDITSREPADVRSPDPPARREDRAVPGPRRGSVSGRQRRPHLLDPGRLHGHAIAIRTRRASAA